MSGTTLFRVVLEGESSRRHGQPGESLHELCTFSDSATSAACS